MRTMLVTSSDPLACARSRQMVNSIPQCSKWSQEVLTRNISENTLFVRPFERHRSCLELARRPRHAAVVPILVATCAHIPTIGIVSPLPPLSSLSFFPSTFGGLLVPPQVTTPPLLSPGLHPAALWCGVHLAVSVPISPEARTSGRVSLRNPLSLAVCSPLFCGRHHGPR